MTQPLRQQFFTTDSTIDNILSEDQKDQEKITEIREESANYQNESNPDLVSIDGHVLSTPELKKGESMKINR